MRSYHAGDTIEDLCRACKLDRLHTVIATDGTGRPIRVQCDFCGSQHNFRGGVAPLGPPTRLTASPAGGTGSPTAPRTDYLHHASESSCPLVSERERSAEPVMIAAPETVDLELLLRRIIREESGLTTAAPAEKWRGGTLILKPGNAALQDKSWPIESFFHKVVMIRNRLRTLEQQINALDLAEDVKVKVQSYITGCYGSLTSFNVLFADESDHFKGAGGE